MARGDIMPFSSALGGHTRMMAYEMGTGSTAAGEDTAWLEGEIMIVDAAAGDINPATDGAIEPDGGLHYIAAASSASILRRNNDTVAGSLVPVYDLYSGDEFVTRNCFATGGGDSNVGPAGTGAMTGFLVGVSCGLWVDDTTASFGNHVHGLDVDRGGFLITAFLDTDGRRTITATDADLVIFRWQSPGVA